MSLNKEGKSPLAFYPLTVERWPDLVKLFGQKGACGGCWCMWWRLSRAEFERKKGAGNRRALHKIVDTGPPPGLLAYQGDEPVGWCAVAPREEYTRLTTSRILGPVDDEPVWSVVCFFVSKPHRRQGVAETLLRAAVRFAGEQGARIVEGYPIAPAKDRVPEVFAYTGFVSTFEKAGFSQVLRRSPTRPIMRCAV